MNLYVFVRNNGIVKSDKLGLRLQQGTSEQVKCGGFLGIGAKLAGEIEITKYEGIPDGIYNGKDTGGVNFEIIFKENKENKACCCKGGKYQWVQKVVSDNEPGAAATPHYDGDGAQPPYYRADPGNPPKLFDGPFAYKNNLSPNGPKVITVLYKTDLVCASDDNKVLKSLRWGFKFSVDRFSIPLIELQ